MRCCLLIDGNWLGIWRIIDPFCGMDSPLSQYSVISTSEIHSVTLPGQMVAMTVYRRECGGSTPKLLPLTFMDLCIVT
jgi:hypothetical protein